MDSNNNNMNQLKGFFAIIFCTVLYIIISLVFAWLVIVGPDRMSFLEFLDKMGEALLGIQR